MCIIMQYWHPRKVIFFLFLLVWAIKTSSSIYLKFPSICRGNSRIFGVRKHLNFRPVGCALGMKFESCDWCPAPPSSYGFFAALVFRGELPNGFLFEIAAGFIHRENRPAIFVRNISAALVLRCCGLLKLGDWKNRRKSTTIDRGSILHKLWHESCFHPCLHFFSPSLPPTKTGWNGLKSLPEIKKDSNYKWGK